MERKKCVTQKLHWLGQNFAYSGIWATHLGSENCVAQFGVEFSLRV